MSDCTEEWLAWRAAGITATDVARAVSGRYGGAYGIVAEKSGRIEREPVNDRMIRGHRWQQRIADAVHALCGLYVVGEETWCQHSEHGWARATVDGFLANDAEVTPDQLLGVLEVKTRGVGVRAAWDYWEPQVQWQMYVTGLASAVVADATVDDDRDVVLALRLTELEADPYRQAELVEIAEEMRAHLDAGTLPEPTDATALPYVKTVTAVADPDAGAVDLSEIADDVRRFAEIRAAVKSVTDEAAEVEARIRSAVGEATVGVIDGVKVTISKPAMVLTAEAEATLLADCPHLGKTVLDRDLAKSVEPVLYEAARRPAGARRLTIKETQ